MEGNRMNVFAQRTEQTIEPMLLTARQAAKVLSISERTLWGLTKSGDIPAVRFGGRNVRYSPDDLKAWIHRRSEKKCKDDDNIT
jgi:excisionase family DNA binding protein